MFCTFECYKLGKTAGSRPVKFVNVVLNNVMVLNVWNDSFGYVYEMKMCIVSKFGVLAKRVKRRACDPFARKCRFEQSYNYESYFWSKYDFCNIMLVSVCWSFDSFTENGLKWFLVKKCSHVLSSASHTVGIDRMRRWSPFGVFNVSHLVPVLR